MPPVWGYSFKSEKGRRVLKFNDNKTDDVLNKLPGKIIENISQISSVKNLLKEYFPENYSLYEMIDQDKDGIFNSRDFLSIFLEIILRNIEYKSKGAKAFISYDILLLKYIQ